MRDRVSSAVCLVFGGLFVAGALQQGLMRRGVPGPGFLPFFSGLALMVVSLFVLVPAFTRRERDEERFFPERDSLKKLLFALAALMAFGVAMVHLGYLLTTFLFMFIVPWIMEPTRWRSFGVLALVAALMSYLLFEAFLEVQLPKGVLGF